MARTFSACLPRLGLGLGLAAAPLGCAQGVVVGAYPITTQGEQEHMLSRQGSYWSAYVQIEGQDIPELWKLNGLDYAVISARVTIPTADGTVVRTVPLFTVNEGTVQIESGTDLLKKMPFQSGTREQVGFELHVTVLRNQRALETARTILEHVDTLVEPFLGNYAVASKILESSLPLIDQLADESRMPSSSATTSVAPETLTQTLLNSGSEGVLYAYFLLPKAHERSMARVKSSAVKDVKPWVLHRLRVSEDSEELYTLAECSDKEGHICLVAPTTSAQDKASVLPQDAVLGLSYNRAVRQIWKDAIPSSAAGLFGELYAVAQAREDEVATALLDEAFAEIQDLSLSLKGVDEVAAERPPAAPDTTTSPAPGASQSADGSQAMVGLDSNAADQDVVFWGSSDELYNEELRYQIEAVFDRAYIGSVEHLRASTSTSSNSYLTDRLDSIAYVTVKFKPYASVYDPATLLEPGRNCASLEFDQVERVSRYLDDNEALFLRHDVKQMRDLLERSNLYLQLSQFVDDGAYGPALDLLARNIQMGRSTNADDMSEVQIRGRRSSHELAHSALDSCFRAQSRIPPLQQIYGLLEAYSTRDKHDDTALRLRELALAFEQFTAAAGELNPGFGPKDALSGSLSSSAMARSLYLEAASLHQQLEAFARQAQCSEFKGRLSELFANCEPCVESLRSRCQRELGDELRNLASIDATAPR